MISKETQYRIYAGTSKDDRTGWRLADSKDLEGTEIWTLDIGSGYFLDTFTRVVKGILRSREVRVVCLRHDRSLEDPEGDYKDADVGMLFNVKIRVSPDALKFEAGKNSFVVLSREPVDWEEFSEGVPTFDDDPYEDNWSSFYS